MARACGLRLGSRRYELAVLDGSPKKPKLVACFGGDLPPHTPEFAKQRRAALRAAFKRVDKGLDNLGVALDVRGAAFRRQTLPVKDPAKIEQVLKYEVESQLPQFDIEDVSVDWTKLDEAGNAASLLVTAVPKHLLAQVIEDCTKAGAEPLDLELETSAMVNAADAAGLLDPEGAQVLVHIGEGSTAVAVVDGGKLRELRAIHIGALAPEDLTEAPEDEAAGGADAPSAEEILEGAETPLEEKEAKAAEWAPARLVSGHQLDEALARIRRELARTVSGSRTANEIQRVLVCGYRLPGMVGGDVMDVPIEAFDTFTYEDGAEDFHDSAAIAYGAALARLGGGPIRAHLRRDELAYTGTWERLELPLAVVSLLLVTFLGVQSIFLTKDVRATHNAIASWRDSSNNFMLGNPEKGQRGNLVNPKEDKLDAQGNPIRDEEGVKVRVGPMDGVVNYVENFCGQMPDGTFRDDPQMEDRVEQLKYIEGVLRRKITELQTDLGQVSDVPVPVSALRGLALVLEDLADNLQTEDWRPSFRRVRSTANDRQGRLPTVSVTMDLSLFAEGDLEATDDYEAWIASLRSEPWCVEVSKSGTTPLETGEGIYTSGLEVTVDPEKAEPKS